MATKILKTILFIAFYKMLKKDFTFLVYRINFKQQMNDHAQLLMVAVSAA